MNQIINNTSSKIIWKQEIKRWEASITTNKNTICLGYFKEFDDAFYRAEVEQVYEFYENHGKNILFETAA